VAGTLTPLGSLQVTTLPDTLYLDLEAVSWWGGRKKRGKGKEKGRKRKTWGLRRPLTGFAPTFEPGLCHKCVSWSGWVESGYKKTDPWTMTSLGWFIQLSTMGAFRSVHVRSQVVVRTNAPRTRVSGQVPLHKTGGACTRRHLSRGTCPGGGLSYVLSGHGPERYEHRPNAKIQGNEGETTSNITVIWSRAVRLRVP